MSELRRTSEHLTAYPKTVLLEDGLSIDVRPLVVADEAALAAFFQTVPERDRWWLREDVSDPAVIRAWVESLNYERVLPLLAFMGEEIIADATLHRRGFGARAHLAEVRVVVSPAYRGRGVGYALLGELVEIAAGVGLERLEAEIAARAQSGALEAVELMGFEQQAILPDHLRGPEGEHHDLILHSYQLAEAAHPC
jgi:GNAT superfamily N-acetyltransferase